MIANEEGDQVQACAVGPMDILDHERDRPLLAEATQDTGQQPRQLAAGRAEKPGQTGLVTFPDHDAEGCDDRSVGKLSFGQVDALADENECAVLSSTTSELADQTALSDPGLTNDQRRVSV